MSITSLDNVAIGMMLVLAFLGIIIVVYHCAKLEKRIIQLEIEQEQFRNEFNTRLLGPTFVNPTAIREWTAEEKETLLKVLNWHMRKAGK
jgi:hypothetical protein